MNEISSELVSVREKRKMRVKSAIFLANASLSTAEMTPLQWSDLEGIPQWCYWPAANITQLALVSGALFTAPSIRMWIEAEKIEAARSVIGSEIFDQIMMLNSLPSVTFSFADDTDLRSLFIAVGASVMLNSLPHQSLRDRLAFLLPQPAGKMTHDVAKTLWLHALTLCTAKEMSEKRL